MARTKSTQRMAGTHGTVRAAIYARYSSDRQSTASVADQTALCQRAAEARGLHVVARFSDAAISGAIARRPGLDALLRAAEDHAFDVVLVESIDRLGRDVGDLDRLRKTLLFRGIAIVGISDGVDTSRPGDGIMFGVRAVLSDEYRVDLARKTHRGLTGRAEKSKITGGIPYGYRSEPSPDGEGRIAVVDDAQAAVVIGIFDRYSRGASLRSITDWLNTSGHEPPRVKRQRWVASTVREILINEKYRGRWVWNTHAWRRDPSTRKRTRIERPAEEWIHDDRPDLAIIDPETWEKVCTRFERQRGTFGNVGVRPTRYLLSGVVTCGCCGEPMHVHGGTPTRRYFGCSGARKRGSVVCTNTRGVPEPRVTEAVLDSLRGLLLRPAAQAALREIVREEIAALAGGVVDARARLSKEITSLETKVGNLIGVLATGLDSPAVRRELATMEARVEELRLELARTEGAASVACPDPDTIAARATEILSELEGDTEAVRESLRRLLVGGRIALEPDGDGYAIKGAWDVGVILALNAETPGSTEESGRYPDMGAGARTDARVNRSISVPFSIAA